MNTPVLLFIFNRPATTRRVLEAIRQARPAQLLVVADGARAGHPDDGVKVRETRALLEGVDWPCRIATNFASENLGCRRRCASGLDWAFQQVDRAIVLEDDCLPDSTFFPFCEALLERYRDDERVQMIRGTNFLRGSRVVPDSYYFSRFFNIWGWATWARAWRHYDLDMHRWPQVRDGGWLEAYLPTASMARLARFFFEGTYAGRIDAWDYPWVLSAWLRDAHAIAPATNLVTNIGFDSDATHTREAPPGLENMPTVPVEFPLRHPRRVAVCERADRLEWECVYPDLAREDSLVERLAWRLRPWRERWRRAQAARKS